MTGLAQFVVNAFATDWRGGNPAAVCVLDDWPADRELQAIASQNNLSETAFFLRPEIQAIEDQALTLRWFTPTEEVDLCGHATLASAHVLYHHLGISDEVEIKFQTRSGQLMSRLIDGLIGLTLPASRPVRLDHWPKGRVALGDIDPQEVLAAEDYLVVYSSAEEVMSLQPDFSSLSALDRRGVIVTAQADANSEDDFVSRFFVPKLGVDEDPVTGSAHCQLIPFWSDRLGQRWLSGWQCSKRGGRVVGQWVDDVVELQGHAVTFSAAQIQVPILAEVIQ